MKKNFNPVEWLDKQHGQEGKIKTDLSKVKDQTSETYQQVIAVIEEIESKQFDIAPKYNQWLDIGFAFAEEFGETGRGLFQRISKFYPKYNIEECDAQYNSCLRSNGKGITLSSFFYHAKLAGVDIGKSASIHQEIDESMPTFPNTIYDKLPDFLQQVVKHSVSNEERDIMLLGSLVCLSACMPKVYGIYDGRKIFPNLFLFVIAKASAGKGKLSNCRQLVEPIHKAFREEATLCKQEFEIALKAYNSKKSQDEDAEKPAPPTEKMLFIPANNSSTGAYQLLADCDGKGLIFETEGDTLAQAFKSDYGDYSDGFRKAFHHETISYYRRTDKEYVEIENPCLSTLLSGTPKQVSSLIPSAENGLFSRFMFYTMNVKPNWKNVFAVQNDQGIDSYFVKLGVEYHTLYKVLKTSSEFRFDLTDKQKKQFNKFFSAKQTQYISLQGIDISSIVRRSGLIAFRIAMILTVLRTMETGDISRRLYCNQRDFKTTLDMVAVLLQHSDSIYSQMPKEVKFQKRKNIRQQFLEILPKEFDRMKYLKVAKMLDIIPKTAEGYIKKYVDANLLDHPRHNHYVNLSKIK